MHTNGPCLLTHVSMNDGKDEQRPKQTKNKQFVLWDHLGGCVRQVRKYVIAVNVFHLYNKQQQSLLFHSTT